MLRLSARARLVAKAVGGLAAVAMFASSLVSLVALDGELAGAISAERRPASLRVSYEVERWEHHADCPWNDRRGPRARVRS